MLLWEVCRYLKYRQISPQNLPRWATYDAAKQSINQITISCLNTGHAEFIPIFVCSDDLCKFYHHQTINFFIKENKPALKTRGNNISVTCISSAYPG